MGKLIDLTGLKFSRLTVLNRNGITKDGHSAWLCICECGNKKTISSRCLTEGKTKSCGCLNKEKMIERSTLNGLSRSRIYYIWKGMIYRCYNNKTKSYIRYGGRGITICDDWKNNYISFLNWSINNGYSELLTIDRINNDGNYEPSNCRWATNKEQQNNTSKNNKITINGITKNVTQWAEISGINAPTLFRRVYNELPNDKLLIKRFPQTEYEKNLIKIKYTKSYYEKNKIRIKENSKKYYELNREKVLHRERNRYYKNKTKSDLCESVQSNQGSLFDLMGEE